MRSKSSFKNTHVHIYQLETFAHARNARAVYLMLGMILIVMVVIIVFQAFYPLSSNIGRAVDRLVISCQR